LKVVFIMCDTLRYDHVSPDIMPNVYNLGQNGVDYTMFFGDGGHTKWSMPHFLCGQRMFDHEKSFPNILTKNQIQNQIVHSNAVLVQEKYQECFDEYLDMGTEKAPIVTGLRKQLKDAGLWDLTRPLRRTLIRNTSFNIPYRRAEAILGTAQEKLNEIPEGFLWVQLMDPHIPYSPPGLSKVGQIEAIKLYDKIFKSLKEEQQFTEIELQRIKALYSAECMYMDKCISDFVKDNPDCIFFISSDHGDMFGENYTYSHSPGPHGVTPQLGHLPLIVYGSGISAKTYDSYNCSINVGSTILDLFSIEERCGYGKSFLNEIYGNK
jgi:arylsulfatase A-like enzyme